MNKAVHWHIKGVGFDAREMAHSAARQAGVPVGEWLNGVIADKARDLGVSPEDFSEDDRLDALVARLAGVAESGQADEKFEEVREAEPRLRASAGRPVRAQPVSSMSVEHDYSERRPDVSRQARRRVDLPEAAASRQRRTPEWDEDLRLDQVLEKAQRRASFDEERKTGERQRLAVAALAKEVERLGRNDQTDYDRENLGRDHSGRSRHAQARPVRDAVSSVAERIEQLESRIAHRDADLANRPIVAALSRLEDRFDHLARRSAEGARESSRVEATFQDLDARLREISQRLDRREDEIPARSLADIERIDANLAQVLARLDANAAAERDQERGAGGGRQARRANRDAIAEIAQRQADLDQSETRRAGLLRGASYPSIREAQRVPASDRDPEGLPTRPETSPELAAMSNLQDAFSRLTERMESRLEEAVRSRAASRQDEDIGSLKSGIAALGERLDVLKRQNDEDRAAKNDRDDIESLRQDIAALQLGLTKLAPQSAISTLADAVRDLGSQIDESRREGVSDAVLAPLERLRQEVRQAVVGQDMRTTVDGVEHQLQVIASRIYGIEARGLDPAEIGVLQEQVGEIRALMHAASRHFQAGERLEAEIGQLAARIERLSETPARAAIRDLELAVNEIRTMLVEFSPDSALQDVSRHLAALADRMESLESQIAPAAMFDEFTRRIEQANHSLAERLIHAMPSAVDLGSVEEMIGGISDKLDGIQQSAGKVQGLEELIRGLAVQMDEARQPSADAKILDTLETQVGHLAERIDRSDASLEAITSVERLVRDLFHQVDETRTAAIEAAETAARSAAQETLRAALVNPSIAGEEASERATRVVEQVGQELSEFRKAQQLSEKRVHATLLALNDTLERMVDRMVTEASPAKAVASTPLPAPQAEPAPVVEQPVAVSERQREDDPPHASAKPIPEPLRAPAAKPAEVKVAAPSKTAPAVEIARPTMGEPMPDVSPLIAAARRAAQAAQVSAAAANREVDRVKADEPAGTSATAKGWRAMFRQRRRPVLLSVASVVLLLGALQIVRMSQNETETAATETDATVADVTPAPAAAVPPAASEIATGSINPALPTPSAVASGAQPAATNPPPAPQTLASLSGDPAPKIGSSIPQASGFAPADPLPRSLPAGLRDMAEHGDAAAQYEVGARLADGRGTLRDLKSSEAWFERAAQQGYAPAQYRVGSIYEKGNGVAADAGKAVEWYEKAANQGNVRAMHNLAVMAAEGGASKPDYTRAATWFTKAAEHGVRDSQYNLAILYARGLGLTQDLAQSYTWFAIAAAQGDADAGKKRDDVGAKLDPAKLAAAKAAADTFKPLSVDRAANDVTPPPGGWDVAAPIKGALPPKVSSM